MVDRMLGCSCGGKKIHHYLWEGNPSHPIHKQNIIHLTVPVYVISFVLLISQNMNFLGILSPSIFGLSHCIKFRKSLRWRLNQHSRQFESTGISSYSFKHFDIQCSHHYHVLLPVPSIFNSTVLKLTEIFLHLVLYVGSDKVIAMCTFKSIQCMI